MTSGEHQAACGPSQTGPHHHRKASSINKTLDIRQGYESSAAQPTSSLSHQNKSPTGIYLYHHQQKHHSIGDLWLTNAPILVTKYSRRKHQRVNRNLKSKEPIARRAAYLGSRNGRGGSGSRSSKKWRFCSGVRAILAYQSALSAARRSSLMLPRRSGRMKKIC